MSMTERETEAVARYEEPQPLTAAQIRTQVNRIQEVMKNVMQDGTHFGKIPGTPKPSLWKPGAEKLLSTFRIAADSSIEADLSTGDEIRYRIRVNATDGLSGQFLGSALGECSSNEEKYKWRAAVCEQEFDETPEDRRRKKWKKNGDNPYAIPQIRTEPADIANTVLKMAVKRALVAVTLQVTAASDIFTQDIEDLPEEVRSEVADEQRAQSAASTQAEGARTITEPQQKRLFAISMGQKATKDQYREFLKNWGFESDRDVTADVYDAMVKQAQDGTFNGRPQQ